MNKKGNAIGIIMVLLLGLVVIGGGLILFGVIPLPQATTQAGAGTQQIVQQVSQASKAGDVSSLGVYVYDTANNNKETKVAVAVYCQDDTGKFVIDGTSSSTSAEITGKTEIGRTVSCWAFNSTYQVSEPVTVAITGESPHVVIKAFKVPTSGAIQFYTDTYSTGTGGVINVSIATAGQTDTLQKMRYTNNASQTIMPLGGFYIAVPAPSNVSNVDIAGSASLHGMTKASTQIVASTLTSRVSSRKDSFDFVYEIDDDSAKEGNQALLMEEQDYLETGTVTVKAESTACSGSSADLISSYSFPKGYYRSQKASAVNYGIETDGITASLLTTGDITGDTFYCTA